MAHLMFLLTSSVNFNYGNQFNVNYTNRVSRFGKRLAVALKTNIGVVNLMVGYFFVLYKVV